MSSSVDDEEVASASSSASLIGQQGPTVTTFQQAVSIDEDDHLVDQTVHCGAVANKASSVSVSQVTLEQNRPEPTEDDRLIQSYTEKCVCEQSQQKLLRPTAVFSERGRGQTRSDRYSNKTVVVGSVIFWSLVVAVVVVTVVVLVTRMDTDQLAADPVDPFEDASLNSSSQNSDTRDSWWLHRCWRYLSVIYLIIFQILSSIFTQHFLFHIFRREARKHPRSKKSPTTPTPEFEPIVKVETLQNFPKPSFWHWPGWLYESFTTTNRVTCFLPRVTIVSPLPRYIKPSFCKTDQMEKSSKELFYIFSTILRQQPDFVMFHPVMPISTLNCRPQDVAYFRIQQSVLTFQIICMFGRHLSCDPAWLQLTWHCPRNIIGLSSAFHNWNFYINRVVSFVLRSP